MRPDQGPLRRRVARSLVAGPRHRPRNDPTGAHRYRKARPQWMRYGAGASLLCHLRGDGRLCTGTWRSSRSASPLMQRRCGASVPLAQKKSRSARGGPALQLERKKHSPLPICQERDRIHHTSRAAAAPAFGQGRWSMACGSPGRNGPTGGHAIGRVCGRWQYIE